MLRDAVERIHGLGWRVSNADVSVVTERPRIIEHREAMRAVLARALTLEVSDVSVKGKTNEGMGWVGRGEGLACIAVVTLSRH
jgi:2-C-methyl-D-erythritol 2,4-cyclodiphosphate synthase